MTTDERPGGMSGRESYVASRCGLRMMIRGPHRAWRCGFVRPSMRSARHRQLFDEERDLRKACLSIDSPASAVASAVGSAALHVFITA
ncbi:hypothetical protein WI24_17245 [Burkholderia thailandensis]|nr:hypothetical protein WI24_17245 [Burkholderia thailandensis]